MKPFSKGAQWKAESPREPGSLRPRGRLRAKRDGEEGTWAPGAQGSVPRTLTPGPPKSTAQNVVISFSRPESWSQNQTRFDVLRISRCVGNATTGGKSCESFRKKEMVSLRVVTPSVTFRFLGGLLEPGDREGKRRLRETQGDRRCLPDTRSLCGKNKQTNKTDRGLKGVANILAWHPADLALNHPGGEVCIPGAFLWPATQRLGQWDGQRQPVQVPRHKTFLSS